MDNNQNANGSENKATAAHKGKENSCIVPEKKIEDTKLGEILLNNGLITRNDLNFAVNEEKLSGKSVGRILVEEEKIKETELVGFLSKYFCIDHVNLNDLEIPKDVIDLVPPEKAVKFRIIPYKKENETLYIAAADPTRKEIIDDISFLTGVPTEYAVASYSQIFRAMSKYYNASFILKSGKNVESAVSSGAESNEIIDVAKDSIGMNSVERYVDKVINDAIERGASDIHIEFYRKFARIRFRIDGKLTEYSNTAPTAKSNIISRIKIMSKLDITEQRFPQDGRITVSIGEHEIDLRVSCTPTLFGEKIVMRILNKSSLTFNIDKIGFSEMHLKTLRDAINKPYGMILVTGPTGAGKTTTLYSILTELNHISLNISTAEDPIEYDFPGINQVQINEKLKNEKTGSYFNFAEALRSFLRQDPDVIMVGEIRDHETASIAIQSALTGHLVLSTIHTNKASSTVTRLINMNIEPFLTASSLNLIIAQRLVRKLCVECREELPLESLKKIGITNLQNTSIKFYRAKGCPACNKTGYKGRTPIYEMLNITEEIKELINKGASESEIEKLGIEQGMKTLADSAKEKFLEGITSLEEILPYLK
ncbi:MAG: ATPase, T2SS/T4P/T4SS family [Deltaproteobacteria bacterium]|nr:ATPase, T2SS/T4P/T4SS family [Deltaproteobacteria bacterium]